VSESTIRDVILIGPMHAGKSTLGRLLAERLGLPQVSMDDVRWAYYKEIGYDEKRSEELRAEGGFLAVYRYWKPFEAYAVERLLAEHRNCVIDFGAGHSVYEDDAQFARIQQILAPYENVVLVLPSPDPEESVQILYERGGRPGEGEFDFTEHFVKHHSNHDLARHVVYTQGKSPEETCEEIMCRIRT
jgi:shikimate kinase